VPVALTNEAEAANVAYDAVLACKAREAVVTLFAQEAVFTLVAHEAVLALVADVAATALLDHTAQEAVLILVAHEAVFALVADVAVAANVAYEDVVAVPNKEPVTPLVTLSEFRVASEPLTMTFFQDGILYTFVLRLDTYTYAVYMPTSH